MILQHVDHFDAQFLRDHLRVLQHVIGGENFVVFVFGRGRPLQILGRNFGRGINPLVFIVGQCFAQQPITFAVPVGPRRVEEIAAQINRQLNGFA